MLQRNAVAKKDNQLSTRNNTINADLNEPTILPKVMSTTMSNPKFVNKSRLILGANKFIGGTYRNTNLQQQMLNQSKTSQDLIIGSLRKSSYPNNNSESYDASNYIGGSSKWKNANNHILTSTSALSVSVLPNSSEKGTVSRQIPVNKIVVGVAPKWIKGYGPRGSNINNGGTTPQDSMSGAAEYQQANLPRQIRDIQQASEHKIPIVDPHMRSPDFKSPATERI